MTLAKPAHRVLEAYRLLGRRLPLTSIQWLARPRYLVLTRDLRFPLPSTKAALPTQRTILTDADIPKLGAVDPAMTRSEVERRVAEGQICCLAWVGPDLAYYSWSTNRPTYLPYLRKTLRPRDGQVYVDLSYTAPAFRMHGIHQSVAAQRLHDEREAGATTHLTLVAWWHQPSLRVFARLGMTIVGSIGFWNLWLWRSYFATGAVRLDTATTFCIDI